MTRRYLVWYLLAAVLLLVPAGVRLLVVNATRSQPLEAAMVDAGRDLFNHEFKPNDPLCNGGDGLGPVFNAASCVACHRQGGPGGGGGLNNNVTAFSVSPATGMPGREGIVHARSTNYRETLNDVHPSLPATSRPTLEQLLPSSSKRISVPMGVNLSQRQTPALFGVKLIDEIAPAEIIAMEKKQRLRWAMAPSSEDLPIGRAVRFADGRVGKFGWKGQTASLAEFVQAACANELGLGNPTQPQPAPLSKPDILASALDLTQEQCDQITAFVASLSPPVERLPADAGQCAKAESGKKLFRTIGCVDCHVPDMGGAKGMYSDLLLHFMGQPLQATGVYYGPPPEKPIFIPGGSATPGEWRTPPLWGCADSAPYLHDGRAETLEDAIRQHGGQGKKSADKFGKLSQAEREQLIEFLNTLRAPGAPEPPAKNNRPSRVVAQR